VAANQKSGVKKAMNEIQVRLTNLSKNYGEVKALRGASFSIKKGMITGFLGENGAGKTTTIRIMMGFLKPDSGQIEMNCSRIGYVPDRPLFFSWLKGKEILELTAKLFGVNGSKLERLVEEKSNRISFDPALLGRKAQTYSMGNQKKMSYLQNLIISPELLIVDEPFSGLDPVSIKMVRDLFLDLKKEGKTIFLSSHLISELEKIVDEVVIIKKGKILLADNMKNLQLSGHSDLEALFLSCQKQPIFND
jgi:ABC-2 type transport system ATP-binding protein